MSVRDWQIGSSKDEQSTAVLDISGDAAGECKQNIMKLLEALSLTGGAEVVVRDLPTCDEEAERKLSRELSKAGSVARGTALPEVPPSKVLVLGAGLVCGPLVTYLHEQPNVTITLASSVEGEADEMAAGRDRIYPTTLNVVEESIRLSKMVSEADMVISLLPAFMHVEIAKLCIDHAKHLVTASYTSPEMRALHSEAVRAGVTIINEVGLDPGLDHMSAMAIIDKVKAAGGKVESFVSLCGGLPSPEAADNPLGYKFSWNPRGVLTASQKCS